MPIDPNTEDITVENITVTEAAVATQLHVPGSALINTASISALTAEEVAANTLTVDEGATVDSLTVTEGAVLERLTVTENAEVDNINVLGEVVTGRLEAYESASIPTLTAGEVSAANLTVNESANINTMYADGIRVGNPASAASLTRGHLQTEVLFANSITSGDVTLKGDVTITKGKLTCEDEARFANRVTAPWITGGLNGDEQRPVTILGDLLAAGAIRSKVDDGVLLFESELSTTGNVTVGGDLSAEDLSCFSVTTPVIRNLPTNQEPLWISGNTTLNGDARIQGNILTTGPIRNTVAGDNVRIEGGAWVTGSLTVLGDGDDGFAGDIGCGGDMNCSGNTTIVGTLACNGDTLLNSDLTCHGDLECDGDLVSNNATFRGDLDVIGSIRPRTPMLPYMPFPSMHHEYGVEGVDKVNILLDTLEELLVRLTEAGIMARN